MPEDRRAPCILVLDASLSMQGRPIRLVNEGLFLLGSHLRERRRTARRVDLLVVATEGRESEVAAGWCDAMGYVPPELDAGGATGLGHAVGTSLAALVKRREEHEASGSTILRPLLFLLSDGAPDDLGWMSVARRCRALEARRELAVYVAGLPSADLEALGSFSRRAALPLETERIPELFAWMAAALHRVCDAEPGGRVRLPEPGWSSFPPSPSVR